MSRKRELKVWGSQMGEFRMRELQGRKLPV